MKPEDEIEARLAKLRGADVTAGAASAQSRVKPSSYSVPSNAFINSDLGDELVDIDIDEVVKSKLIVF